MQLYNEIEWYDVSLERISVGVVWHYSDPILLNVYLYYDASACRYVLESLDK